MGRDIETLNDFIGNYAFVTPIDANEPLYEGYIDVINANVVAIYDLDKNYNIIRYKHIKVIEQDNHDILSDDEIYKNFYKSLSYKRITPISELDKKIAKAMAEYKEVSDKEYAELNKYDNEEYEE